MKTIIGEGFLVADEEDKAGVLVVVGNDPDQFREVPGIPLPISPTE